MHVSWRRVLGASLRHRGKTARRHSASLLTGPQACACRWTREGKWVRQTTGVALQQQHRGVSSASNRRPLSSAALMREEPDAEEDSEWRSVHGHQQQQQQQQQRRRRKPHMWVSSIDSRDAGSDGLLGVDVVPPEGANAGVTSFALDGDFIEEWRHKTPPFGFNGLGELVFRRTYARFVEEEGEEGDEADSDHLSGEDVGEGGEGEEGVERAGGGAQGKRKEEWFETVQRVVNGTFTMQKEWAHFRGDMGWDEEEAQALAQEMYRRIFLMKFLPPGRGLWAMGTKMTSERRLYAALNNCAFVSTQHLSEDPAGPFCFLMDASMLGVGVGFDTLGANAVRVQGALPPGEERIVVEDSREGWRDSVQVLLEAHFLGRPLPVFDTSLVRPAGSPIKGFGGVSQGAEPLLELHEGIKACLGPLKGKMLTVTALVDIMNLIGKCVVAGNVRRTAEIAFGDFDSDEYIDLKDYTKNPGRQAFGWTSNNSVFAELDMDYKKVCERVQINGEPGFAWLDNMRRFGRMGDPPNDKDRRAMGGNPCLEQTLESGEICCLVETFPSKHESKEDFLETLWFAFLYAKTVTLGGTKWGATNEVLARNRRIGCSMSGLAQFVTAHGLDELREWCDSGYSAVQGADEGISRMMGVPKSIKTTSIKPSGTVSLLAGATPGMHYPEARFYLRRVRMARSSELLPALQAAGYEIAPCASAPETTVVVEVPVDAGENISTAKSVSMDKQLHFAAFLQRHWADNQVSCTITFDPESEGPLLAGALDKYQHSLKGVSFLPRIEHGAFPQMPYEAIDRAEYERHMSKITAVDFRSAGRSWKHTEQAQPVESVPDKFCSSERCTLL